MLLYGTIIESWVCRRILSVLVQGLDGLRIIVHPFSIVSCNKTVPSRKSVHRSLDTATRLNITILSQVSQRPIFKISVDFTVDIVPAALTGREELTARNSSNP